MIYQEYGEFICPMFQQSHPMKMKLDSITVKKALEELANSNLISIMSDERYVNTYELKQPLEVTQNLLFRLDEMKYGNFDTDMRNFLNVKFN